MLPIEKDKTRENISMNDINRLYWATIFLALGLAAASYLLRALAYRAFARRLSVRHRCLAFIPVADYALLAQIQKALGNRAGRVRYMIFRGLGLVCLGLYIWALSSLYVPVLTLSVAALHSMPIYDNPIFTLQFYLMFFSVILAPFDVIIPCIYHIKLLLAVEKLNFRRKRFMAFALIFPCLAIPFWILTTIAAAILA